LNDSLKARDRLELVKGCPGKDVLVKMSTSRTAAGDRIEQLPADAAQEYQAEVEV